MNNEPIKPAPTPESRIANRLVALGSIAIVLAAAAVFGNNQDNTEALSPPATVSVPAEATQADALSNDTAPANQKVNGIYFPANPPGGNNGVAPK